MGAVLIGGLIEGCLGLLARYWKKIITPIVAASVVTSIGFSLFSVGTRSFGGGYSWKQLSVLFGLIVGYILAIFMGKVDLSIIFNGGLITLPHLLPFKIKFDLGAIIAVVVIFLVSAAETIGDTQPL